MLAPDPRFATPQEWEAYLAALYDTELVVEISDSEVTRCGGAVVILVQGDPGKWILPDFPVVEGFKHATLKLSGCTIAECNSTGVSVEAGRHNRARVVMDRCIVRDNGGAGVSVYSEGATWNGAVVEVNNCVIAHNEGTGIFALSFEDLCWNGICQDILYPWEETGEIYASSSTIAYNGVSVDGSLWLDNCIVYGNTDPPPNPPFTPDRGIVSGGNNCVQWEHAAGKNGNINSAPLFVDPENNDFRLLPGSPCIDKGGLYWKPTIALREDASVTISFDPGTDLDGNPRVRGKGPDIGTHESPGAETYYVLESSDDLVTWRTEDYGPGPVWYDWYSDACRRRFYRIRVAMD